MTGYGLTVHLRGRAAMFGGLSKDPHIARRRGLAIARDTQVVLVEVDRWERGRITRSAMHTIETIGAR